MNQESYQLSLPEPGQPVTARDIVTPIFRHRKLAFWTFLSLVAATLIGVIVLPKSYQAEMKILVKHDRVDTAVSPGRSDAIANLQEVSEEELNSEVELLKSRDLLEKVVVACGLEKSQPAPWHRFLLATVSAQAVATDQSSAKTIAQATSDLEAKLDIEPLNKTDLIQVRYSSRDPQQAALVLNELGNLYLEKTVAVHSSPGAFAFFQSQSQKYDQELRGAESQLTDFDRAKGVVDATAEKQIAIQKLAEFKASIGQTDVAVTETRKRISELRDQLATTPKQTTSQVHSSDNPYLMQQLKTTLLALQQRRTELLEKFEPDYRPVQEVQQEIDQTLDAIAKAQSSPVRDETTDRNPTYEWLQAELTKSNADLASLQARATETQKVIDQYKAELVNLDATGAKQGDLQRDVKEAEDNYSLYVQKREEARIGEALDNQRIVNVAIAEAATIPTLPAHQFVGLMLVFGILLAGFISSGFAFVVDHFDPSVRTRDELQACLNIPVLAVLNEGEGNINVS